MLVLRSRANISFAFRGVQTTLPPNLRGWETGTLEIDDVSFATDSQHKGDFEAEAQRLRVVTTDKVEVLSKKEARVENGTVKWEMDRLRLPVYSRYQSSVIFEIGKASGILSTLGVKPQPDAIAVLWMQDLTDDVEQDIRIPVLQSGDLANLRQHAINDQTRKFHDFEIVGTLTARIKLDSGLDEDHEVGQRSRHRDGILTLAEAPIESISTTCSGGLVRFLLQHTLCQLTCQRPRRGRSRTCAKTSIV